MQKIDTTIKTITNAEKDWVMWAHLSGLLAGFIFPFGNIIAPALIMSIKSQESKFIYEHAKESLNFQITITIASIISLILVFLLVGVPMLIALLIIEIVWVIQAVQAGREGKMYSYPMNIRFIK